MYTYHMAYFGYPLDHKTRAELSEISNELIKNAYQEGEKWLSSSYHGADESPKYVGMKINILTWISATDHTRLSQLVKQPTPEQAENHKSDFQKIWEQVPEELRAELEKIYGHPEYWVTEVSS